MSRQKKGDIETNYEVRSCDARVSIEEYASWPKTPLFIILDNVRSAFNTGSIFRICDALRVEGLYLCGYTPYPPHIKLQKTSLGTISYVPWKHFETTIEAIGYLKDRNTGVWAAETTSRSVPYNSIAHTYPTGFVFGNETSGIGREVLDRCDGIVELPMCGFKNSVNVAASSAVIGYEFLARYEKSR